MTMVPYLCPRRRLYLAPPIAQTVAVASGEDLGEFPHLALGDGQDIASIENPLQLGAFLPVEAVGAAG